MRGNLLRTGRVPARAWEGQAVGIAPAAGKKVSLSLSMEVNNLELEEELTTMTTLAWAEGVWFHTW